VIKKTRSRRARKWCTRRGIARTIHLAETENKRWLLAGNLLEERNQICPLALLLNACENHFGAWDILLRVEEIIKERLVAPRHTRVLVRSSIREALYGSGNSSEQAVQIGALLGPC
jgi:hypothetical protein